MKTEQLTPLPWRTTPDDPETLNGCEAWGECHAIISCDPNPVREHYVGFVLKKADAAFLVRAANAHADLVAALERTLARLKHETAGIESCDLSSGTESAIEEAEAALAKATNGGQP